MLRKCPDCKKKNRIPPARLADTGKCGACQAKLPPLDQPLEVGPEEFKKIVKEAKVPVLVDFWAEWCMPCRMAAPEVKRTAQKMAGKAIVLKVNTEEHPELARIFDVQGIPNFAVLKDGDLVMQQPGLVDHRQMVRWIEEAA